MSKQFAGYGAANALLNKDAVVLQAYSNFPVPVVLCIAYSLFGVGAIFVKLAVHANNPVFFELLREVISAPLLFLLAIALGKNCVPHRMDAMRFLAAGFCLFGNQMCRILGLKFTGPVLAAVWQSSFPVVAAGAAVYAGRGPDRRRRAVGVILAVVGGIFILIIDSHQAPGGDVQLVYKKWGHALLLTRGGFNVAYIYLAQDLSFKYEAIPAASWCFTIGSLLSLVLYASISAVPRWNAVICWGTDASSMIACMDGSTRVTAEMLVPLAFEVVCCTLWAWVLLMWSTTHVKASEAATFVGVQLASACALSTMLVMTKGPAWAIEHGIWHPGAKNVVGAVLIVVGTILITVEGATTGANDERKALMPRGGLFLPSNRCPNTRDKVTEPV